MPDRGDPQARPLQGGGSAVDERSDDRPRFGVAAAVRPRADPQDDDVEIVALIPGLVALVWAIRKGPERAFLDVYLFVLLCLPSYYRWKAPGLPDPNFQQAAIFPIFALATLKLLRTWRFTATDALVGAFAFACAYSEYRAAGYAEAQNLVAEVVLSVIMPYMLAKGFIEPQGMRVAIAKRYALLLAGVAVFSVWEFKMGYSVYQHFLSRIFPWQGMGWVTTFRWGFARIAGPFAHAILAGLVFATGYRIARWLEWGGHQERKFKFWANHPLTKGRIITLAVFGGVVMSLCRGPWLGAILGALLVWIGKQRNRWAAVAAFVALGVFVAFPAAMALKSYASVERSEAASASQETAAYRKKLLDEYVQIALEHAAFGWGRNTWPKVLGMPSIDNNYLLLALMHGLIALGAFVSIMLWVGLRLFMASMSRPPPRPFGSDFGFTLLGVYGVYALTVLTVYMGEQTLPIFFLFTGWAEGYLLLRPGAATATSAEAVLSAPAPLFRRVLV